jgi:hypothetical protein
MYCSLAGLLFFATTVHAQDAPAWKHFRIGPAITAGASVNAGPVAEGWKTSPQFALSVDALGNIPLIPEISLDLSVGYNLRAINFHDQADPDHNKFNYSMSYAVLQPEFVLKGFTVGFGLGIPVSGSYDYTYKLPSTTKEGSLATGAMTTQFEIRLGGDIPIVESDAGKFLVLIRGAYSLSDIFSHDAPFGTLTKNNGPLATLQMGFSYLFDFTKPHP